MRRLIHAIARTAADDCDACGWWSKPFCGH